MSAIRVYFFQRDATHIHQDNAFVNRRKSRTTAKFLLSKSKQDEQTARTAYDPSPLIVSKDGKINKKFTTNTRARRPARKRLRNDTKCFLTETRVPGRAAQQHGLSSIYDRWSLAIRATESNGFRCSAMRVQGSVC